MSTLNTEQQLAARLAILHNPQAQNCTVYRADEHDPEAEEQDLGDAKVLFLGAFEAPADWDALEREEYFADSAPELFVNARIECEASPGSKTYFSADIGDYVAAQPSLGEVVMYYVHDYVEDDTGLIYVLQRDEEVLE
ncbi:hypothetical protein [Pseudomonas sp. 5P_3.1_Bac2]|uniref:hypothetical protein n=1 Tax=Pseudomonas sp. 5P_3.1_Bac2 TaxID=2971617 RepID=UPI0021CA4070|nr:hypothetical protein [Pseudomonas sp. 5P_3.1_Bac2]MCU1718851.1 hypothetical protein [Pseudomonas sp. 5P_3.1_Bac2]